MCNKLVRLRYANQTYKTYKNGRGGYLFCSPVGWVRYAKSRSVISQQGFARIVTQHVDLRACDKHVRLRYANQTYKTYKNGGGGYLFCSSVAWVRYAKSRSVISQQGFARIVTQHVDLRAFDKRVRLRYAILQNI